MFFVINILENGIKEKKTRYACIFILFILNAVFSVLVNMVPLPNIIFSIISFLPFIAFLCLLDRNCKTVKFDYTEHIDKVLFIEFISVPMNFIFYYSTHGEDWSKGTFGMSEGEQAQLFVIAAFLTVYYLYGFISNQHNKKTFVKTILSFVIALSTNCWTLLAALAAGIILSYVLALNKKKMLIAILILALFPIGYNVVLKVLPDRIVFIVNRIISDDEYFNYRFHKAVVYKETFVEIPGKDIKFALIGAGAGNYNSRAALICTGEYVGFYESIFSPSISKYTMEYIYDYVKLAHDNGGSDYGSVLARPYSSILALMGECGYIGFGLFIILMIMQFRKKQTTVNGLLIIWISFCFVENYFEYSKVLLVLCVCIFSAGQLNLSEKVRRKKEYD